MEENIRVIGDIIKCMVMVFISGQMEEHIMVSIMRIKNMEGVNICGQMEGCLKESG